MSQIALKIGPADNCRAMTLDDFEQADFQEDYLCEFGSGVGRRGGQSSRLPLRDLRSRLAAS